MSKTDIDKKRDAINAQIEAGKQELARLAEADLANRVSEVARLLESLSSTYGDAASKLAKLKVTKLPSRNMVSLLNRLNTANGKATSLCSDLFKAIEAGEQ